ncbi:MAG: hypothetical protein K1X78_04570 [Verrucomicrobiaceae bacterium]|nr:hypothetical protein [Verrucomicrobiaceae bacterium]
MSTITITPAELKNLIQSAVDEAFERHAAAVREEMEYEEVVDHNLGRLVDECLRANEPTTSGEEFLTRLKASL